MKQKLVRTFAILYLLVCVKYTFAQQAGIYIIDALYKTPIASAIVENKLAHFNTLSNENGFVSLSHLPTHADSMYISCIGYESKHILLSTLNLNSDTNIVYLYKKITGLSEVKIKTTNSKNIFKTISDIDIHLRPIINSQEVLRMVPGLFIGQHAGGGKAEQIFLRGFDLDHGTDINIAVDGMPVNMVSHAHGQGYADLHFVIPELIQNVNFNKGPYFADKGNFNTAGFVEFRTKDFLESNFLKAEVGQFNTYRAVAGVNVLNTKKQKRDQNLYIAAEASFSDGYFVLPQNFYRYNGIIKYSGRLNKYNTLTATLTGFASKWNASGQIPDRAVADGTISFYGSLDSNEGGQTSRYNANLQLLTHFKDGSTLTNQVFYSRYAFQLFSNFTFFLNDSINGDLIRQTENRNIVGYNSTYRKEYFIGKIKSETQAGIQIRYDQISDLELTRMKDRTTPTAELKNGNVNELNVGAFVMQRFEFTPKFDMTIGLRADYFYNRYKDKLQDTTLSANSAIVSPKINFNYRINDYVQLYLYGGKGFHSNDTRVVVLDPGRKSLPPAYGGDLGGIFKIGKRIFLQAALWYLWLQQEFVYVGDEAVVELGGQTQRYGVDLSLRYEIINHLFLDADFSYAHPRALGLPKSESYLPLAPIFTSTGGLTYRRGLGFNGSLRYRYMADRPANETNTIIAKGYFIMDAVLNYTFKRCEVGIAIQNLFNTKWKETQFNTLTRLRNETTPVEEICFTPGTPFFARLNLTVWF